MDREAEVLFHELADLSPAERERYFQEHSVPADIRAEVEQLLDFDRGEAASLTQCVAEAAAAVLERREDTRCGPYRLVRTLGQGGMGSVYLAERADGEVEQRVAIKLLRFGGADAAFRDRFLRERQILATLQHPGIARLLDAGHTTDGQPFLVMDYIDGSPIDVYAATLELRAKLKLFLEVCEAVSYAHRNLIIHRDLKPSNILVDRDGRPRLLDFGIARILDAQREETRAADNLLTPGYASPEQFRGAAQTTATDVYSLGAVLYKLLTGRSPHAPVADGPEDLVAAICSREPDPPSRVTSGLPRDLDFIAGKALRKEPEERYPTVEALADDLRAFLEWRPVRARSGDAWYRMRRFARRYWLPVGAAAAVMASLASGLYVANRERTAAEHRFQQLRELSNQVFDFDRAIRNLPGSAPARQRLVAASLQYLEGLGAEAHGDLDLDQEIADGYWRVARVQGVPLELNLGQFDHAELNLKKADALTETVLAARPGDRSALYRSANIARDRMILAQEENRRADAMAHARKAEDRANAFLRLGAASESERDALARLYGNIAQAYRNMHVKGDSLRNAQRSVEIARSLHSGEQRLSTSLSLLALDLREQGDLDGALRAIREARQLAERATYPSGIERMMSVFAILSREGVILAGDAGVSLGRPAEAVEPLEKALEITEAAARENPKDQTSRSRLGTAARDLGAVLRRDHPERALEVYDLGIRRLREVQGNAPIRRQEALLLANSSYPLRALHRRAEAKQRIGAALQILSDAREYPAAKIAPDGAVYATLRALADFQADVGDTWRAIEVYEQLLDGVMASKPDPQNDLWDATNLSRLYGALAALYRKTGDDAKGAQMEACRQDLWQGWDRKLPHNPFVERQLAAR